MTLIRYETQSLDRNVGNPLKRMHNESRWCDVSADRPVAIRGGTIAWAADDHGSRNHDALGVETTVVIVVE
jgi:hypothetical protein